MRRKLFASPSPDEDRSSSSSSNDEFVVSTVTRHLVMARHHQLELTASLGAELELLKGCDLTRRARDFIVPPRFLWSLGRRCKTRRVGRSPKTRRNSPRSSRSSPTSG
ncbi:unnamed protein product [Cochlearia groenlandica]